MKCKLVYPAEVPPKYVPYALAERADDIRPFHNSRGERVPDKPGCPKRWQWKTGTILEHPQAYLLVQNGHAIPADEECREKAGMTKDQMIEAQRNYAGIRAGATPEDMPLFRAGAVIGYDGEGNYVPGPNWHAVMSVDSDWEVDDPVETAREVFANLAENTPDDDTPLPD